MDRIQEGVQAVRRRNAIASLLRPARRALDWAEGHPSGALLLIGLLVLALGAAKLWLDRPSFEFNWENRWWQIALHLAHGQGYVSCKPIYFPFCGPENQVTAMREPLPVLLFALIALVSRESLLAAAASGVIANLLATAAVFFLARTLTGRHRVGLLAALLWAVYLAPVRFFYSHLSGDLLATLFLTAGMAFFVRARSERARRLDWAAAGLLTGLAVLSRSAVLAVALALAAGLLIWPSSQVPRPRPGRLRPLAWFTLACVLTIAPWLIRNAVAFGRPVIGSTLAGYYLYRQNHMLESEDYLRFVSGGEFLPVLEQMVTRRTDLRGDENEAEMDQVYREEGLRHIRAAPLRYVALSGYRFFMLWFNWGVNEVYGKQNNFADRLILLQHAFFLVLGTAGLIGRLRRAWPLALGVAAFSLLCMAVMAHIPYIIPVVPLLAVPSAAALEGAFRRR